MPLETLENSKSFLEQRTKINAAIDEVNTYGTAAKSNTGTSTGEVPLSENIPNLVDTHLEATSGLNQEEVGNSLKGPRKCLVIFGSSNGAGLGASDYFGDPSAANGYSSPSKSWAGLLEAQLKSIDSSWDVYNRSKSGSNTSTSVSRFFTDVAIYRPSHVLICTALGNESYDALNFLTNISTLVRYCEQIGAKPILRGAYPRNGMTAVQYNVSKTVNSIIESFGYPCVDNLSALDNGTGSFYDSATYSTDGTHLTDAGQLVFLRAIDTQMFTTDYTYSNNNTSYGVISSATDKGIRVHTLTGMEPYMESFSVLLDFETSSSPADKRLATTFNSIGGGDSVSFSILPNGNFGIIGDDNVTILFDTGFTASANTRYKTLFTYNNPRQELEIFVNGASYGTYSFAQEYFFAITLCGKFNYISKPPTDFKFYKAEVFRTSKNISDAKLFNNGKDITGSKFYSADFGSCIGAEFMPNAIKNGLLPTILENWDIYTV